VVLSPHLFYRATTTDNLVSHIRIAQQEHLEELEKWVKKHNLTQEGGIWTCNGQLAIPSDNTLRRSVLVKMHDDPSAGHPGILKTIQITGRCYWWPQLRHFITSYVKGCMICQSPKPTKNKKRVPLYPIAPKSTAIPFSTIAPDFIMDLPKSSGYDAILTITDHDVTKAAIFLPCNTTITSEEVAALYTMHVFPHFRTPRKIISDCDVRFTSHFSKELC
jgi:Integrase zinc binding domain